MDHLYCLCFLALYQVYLLISVPDTPLFPPQKSPTPHDTSSSAALYLLTLLTFLFLSHNTSLRFYSLFVWLLILPPENRDTAQIFLPSTSRHALFLGCCHTCRDRSLKTGCSDHWTWIFLPAYLFGCLTSISTRPMTFIMTTRFSLNVNNSFSTYLALSWLIFLCNIFQFIPSFHRHCHFHIPEWEA